MIRKITLTCLALALLYCSVIGQVTNQVVSEQDFTYRLLDKKDDVEVLRFSNYRNGTNLSVMEEYPDPVNQLIRGVRNQVLIGKIDGPVVPVSYSELKRADEIDLEDKNFSIIYGLHIKQRSEYVVRVREIKEGKKYYHSLGFEVRNNQVGPLEKNNITELWLKVTETLKYKQLKKLFGGFYSQNAGVLFLREACAEEGLSVMKTPLDCLLRTLFTLDEAERKRVLNLLN